MAKPGSKHTRSKRSLLLQLMLFIGLIIGTWSIAYKLNYNYEQKAFNDSVSEISRGIDLGIGQIQTVLASVVALHYASDSVDTPAFSAFFQQLRGNSNFIRSIGRFEKIDGGARKIFERQQQTSTGENYFISSMADSGQTMLSEPQAHYFPISLVNTDGNNPSDFVGLDINSIQGVSWPLKRAIDQASPYTFATPQLWPANGNVLVITPTYGSANPKTTTERRFMANGGYWINISAISILHLSSIIQNSTSFSVSIENSGVNNTIIDNKPDKNNRALLSFLYPTEKIQESWPLGASTINLTISKELGIKPVVLLSLLTFTVLGSILFFLVSAFTYEKQSAKQTKQRNQEILYQEREKAEKTLNAISDSVITLDNRSRILHMNPAAEGLFNTRLPSALGHPIQELFNFNSMQGDCAPFSVNTVLKQLKIGEEQEHDIQRHTDTHESQVMELSMSRTVDKNNASIGYIMVLRDVSNERKLTRELEYQANHDPLTGCANRYFFEKELSGLLDDSKISGRQHAVCYLDLDQFKIVNDTCGHMAGDKLLCELTENLNTLLRRGDVLARLGGDEFGLIIVDVNLANAEKIAEKLYLYFQTYVFQYDDNAFSIRASIGLVPINERSGAVNDILAAADIACNTAKDSGRNSLNVYSEENENMVNRHKEMSWLPRLQSALRNDEFTLLVQAVAPIGAHAKNSAHLHFEFLLRLKEHDGKLTTPFHFIQAAERYDLMRQIDKWVIKEAIDTISQLPQIASDNFTFSINLSGQSVADTSLLGYIKSMLSLYHVRPEQVWFELTETAAISHFDTAQSFMEELRQMGSKVALDDFGSGLSSFGYLKNFPIDILKIDGQFVKDLANNLIDKEMVKAINNIGKAMNITTVAEFVETAEIVDVLVELGVDYAQGYYIAKPCSIAEALEDYKQTGTKAA